MCAGIGCGQERRENQNMEILQQILGTVVEAGILIFEYIGVAVLLYAGVRGMIDCLRKNPETRLNLARGLAMGLEFKLGSEILRTVVVREMEELLFVAGIIALRAILTILIHWEIKNEEKQEMK